MKIVPKVSKIRNSDKVLIERSLPRDGEINIKKGEEVEPFTKLGVAKVSFGRLPLPSSLSIEKRKRPGDFFYTGDMIGRVGSKKIIAPFDGRLKKYKDKKKGYVFEQEERDFWLLAGVWGNVVDLKGDKSVLLKTQTTDLHFTACTKMSYAGELIVFPNPSDLLKVQYLEKFSKDPFGKIIYLGDHLNLDIVERAADLGVAGLIGGSADREAFAVAKQKKMFLGVFSGFGEIPTPRFMFDFLKEISNRFVFLQGSRGLLRIPYPAESPPEQFDGSKDTNFTTIEEGKLVQVLQSPHFGLVGEVSEVQNESVYVMLDDVEDLVEVHYRNLLALE